MTNKKEKEFISNPVEAYENVVKQPALKTQECARYRKALKKIEKYCIDQNLKYDYTACEILDIINKAKGDK